MAADSTDRYELGPVVSTAPMWTIIRGYVREGYDSYPALLAAMMNRRKDDWPKRVLDADSVQGVGSEMWCRGYINGAIREEHIKKI